MAVPVLIFSAGAAIAEPDPTPAASTATPSGSAPPSPARSAATESAATPTPAASAPSPGTLPSSLAPQPQTTPELVPAPEQGSPSATAAAEESIGAAALVTTSGVLRDALTGAPIPSSCVAFRTAGAEQTYFANVNWDGTFSFVTDDVDGPVSLAFYVVADFDCSGPVSDDYVPAWFENQAFTGTDPGTATPPDGATAVSPGSTDIVACLAPDRLPTECLAPTAVLSGRVVTTGPRPLNQACVFVLRPGGDAVGVGVTDADGRWTLTGLPNNTPFVIAVMPPVATDGPPCQFDGPPPAPAAGELQPEFYRNIWVDLTPDPSNPLFQDVYGWAIEHGATTVTNGGADIDVCLTTDPGTVVPRPGCAPAPPAPTPTASGSEPTSAEDSPDPGGSPDDEPRLAATGGPAPWLLALAAALIGVGATTLRRSAAGRR